MRARRRARSLRVAGMRRSSRPAHRHVSRATEVVDNAVADRALWTKPDPVASGYVVAIATTYPDATQYSCRGRIPRRFSGVMDDEPELYVFRPPDLGDDWRAQRERQRVESRARHLERMTAVLAFADACADDLAARAGAVLDGFFVTRGVESGEPCTCSCHPQLPETDLHGYGSDCSCRRTATQRQASWAQWQAEQDRYWASPEGLAITAEREAERAALAAWVEADSGVVVTSHGGWAPEQWWGSVDGHTFYFRERHDCWRIELDLATSGRFVEVRSGGDLDGGSNRRTKELEEGEVVAEGVADCEGYGSTAVERAQFIVGTIRAHLCRASCTTHTAGRHTIEELLARPMQWCPECGTQC